jgi:hypothetical protein
MFSVPLRIDYRWGSTTFFSDRVGCKEAPIIATLMRSIAHQCVSRQDPPLSNGQLPSQSWMMPRQRLWSIRFYIHFRSDGSFRAAVSTMGSFLVTSSNLIFSCISLHGMTSRSTVISFDLLLSHFSCLFVVYLTQLKFSPLFPHTHTHRSGSQTIDSRLSCGYKPLNFGGHTQLVLVWNEPWWR